jgi:hypothetical protein
MQFANASFAFFPLPLFLACYDFPCGDNTNDHEIEPEANINNTATFVITPSVS